MSILDRIQHPEANLYVIPREEGMLVDALLFMSPELFEHAKGQQTDFFQQMINGASYPGVEFLGVMPDGHPGYGVPIGSVMVTDGVIVQASVGYDINCGVLAVRTDLHARDVTDWDLRHEWIKAVAQRVDMGLGTHRPPLMPTYTDEMIHEIVHYGAHVFGAKPEQCERPNFAVAADYRTFDPFHLDGSFDRAKNQLGSLGKGNHFIEMQVDRDDGSVWVMVHCGSRNYGWNLANYYFHKGAEVRGIEDKKRQQSYLYVGEPMGQEFMNAHNAAANYAQANRFAIAASVIEALGETFGEGGEVYFDITHNLAQWEDVLQPDGTYQERLVQRKGATRAFPAGHPELSGTPWSEEGHPCLIPGSMYTGAAILRATENAHDSACTVNHGSGRARGAKDTKRRFEDRREELTAEMNETVREFDGVPIKGVASNKPTLPLDECDRAYKPLDEVLETLEATGIARIERRMYPVCNCKG